MSQEHHQKSTTTTTTSSSSSSSSSSTQATPDWSANQYLKFGSERTRAVHDLVANIPLQDPKHIIDLGCGPGNSTAVLASRWPDAQVSGVDSSPDMLAKARANLPGVTFTQADLHTYEPPTTTTTSSSSSIGPGTADLLFSNAVFHWLRREQRIPTVQRLLSGQCAGGVLALQVPDNYEEPSHKAMRETALLEGPWTEYFQEAPAEQRPDLDPIETPAEWYDALQPLCARVDVWHVLYQHVMESPAAIVEWVKGTGLMPFLNLLPTQEIKDAYLKAYEQRLGEMYPRLIDGKVMLRYPRLFVVATRK
ncbi:S-adenosyl-L-methionine-dependent methyltransferase [Cryphonectria parasitica EP155]|uniref:S-adenosyl-L-methionine-dependent methyltransferase n=1 Tax=Cryphonectria parasitica (strain ATCC 38755 / EP155) TaxID=660469 RepID=A0A9P4XWM2_CRYP1|nr:S-adenosyl-L-methionine-dependent methyltransferase [Cryphonectria parasitica EP155]KAF3761925.1 S-adenosyl-L-methionine-dependent methyltransferase [Cryphonectria parasitica EP155]